MRILPRSEIFVVEVLPDVLASANDWVRLIESEDSLLGDD
jgi:hypothetical protein